MTLMKKMISITLATKKQIVKKIQIKMVKVLQNLMTLKKKIKKIQVKQIVMLKVLAVLKKKINH